VADAAPGETGVLLAARLEVLGTYADPVRLESSTCSEVVGKSNGNGHPDPGETLRETAWLRNLTTGSLTGLTATLSCTLPGVTVLVDTSAYPPIPAGQSASNSVPFEYRVAKGLCGAQIPFTLVASNSLGRVTNTFTRLVGRPVDQPPVTNVFASADVPQPVPDVTTVYSTLTIPPSPGEVLDDVNVSLRMDHTAVGDLQLALRHPDGTEVILADHEGGNNPDFGTGTCGVDAVPTVLDDQAGTAIAASDAPFAGSFRPDELLSAFAGKSPGGLWTLRVSDAYDGDSGTLHCWSLETVSHLRTLVCDVFNVPPVATALAVTVREGMATNAVLPGSDADGDAITFFTNSPPQHGVLVSFNRLTGAFTYTATGGYSGPDSFTFGVNDGYTNSALATASVTIVSALTNVTFLQPAFQFTTGFRVEVAGAPGTDYLLEATTNFTQWDRLTTNAPVSSPFWLTDPQATNLPHRFYRLRR
jgi:subtilisin-like proprotein convertase family protein